MIKLLLELNIKPEVDLVIKYFLDKLGKLINLDWGSFAAYLHLLLSRQAPSKVAEWS